MNIPAMVAEVKTIGGAAVVVLGAVSTAATAIGNPIAKWASNPKLSNVGHLILAFGVDIGKIRARLAALFPGAPPPPLSPDDEITDPLGPKG